MNQESTRIDTREKKCLSPRDKNIERSDFHLRETMTNYDHSGIE